MVTRRARRRLIVRLHAAFGVEISASVAESAALDCDADAAAVLQSWEAGRRPLPRCLRSGPRNGLPIARTGGSPCLCSFEMPYAGFAADASTAGMGISIVAPVRKRSAPSTIARWIRCRASAA